MKTYTGGCHCGKVRYEVELPALRSLGEAGDIESKPVMECNCSHCAKKGFLLTFVPASQFRLLSGEADLSEYRFNTGKIGHLFCKHCGVQSFGRGQNKAGEPTVMINVRCLDDVDPSTLTITQVDGKSF